MDSRNNIFSVPIRVMHYLYESFQSNLIGQPYDLQDSVGSPFLQGRWIEISELWLPQTTPQKMNIESENGRHVQKGGFPAWEKNMCSVLSAGKPEKIFSGTKIRQKIQWSKHCLIQPWNWELS